MKTIKLFDYQVEAVKKLQKCNVNVFTVKSMEEF